VSSVQSIERAFLVLRAVATGPAGISDVARRVDLPTSTVARLLGTLEGLGAVTRVGDGVTYRVGPAVAELATAADPSSGLVAAARLFLVELVEEVRETAGISVLDGDEVLYLDHVDAALQVQIRDWSGARLPLHVVSSGLVLLAHRPADEIEAYLSRPLEAFTARTVTDPAAIRRRLEQVRDGGFAWTAEELHEGLTSVAAPVRGPSAVVAALHCHGPSFRFPVPGTEDKVGTAVRDVAERFSARMTGSFWSRNCTPTVDAADQNVGGAGGASHDAVLSRIVDNGVPARC
jgi:DNA-binding IclR family transcriptional regulator